MLSKKGSFRGKPEAIANVEHLPDPFLIVNLPYFLLGLTRLAFAALAFD